MTQVVGTFDTYGLKGRRESFIDAIYNISPSDTPFVSMIGREDVGDVRHNWQTDALRAAVATNAAVEGDEYTYVARTATAVVSNLCQISIEPFIISGTAEVINKWGRKSEIAYQKAKAIKAVKLDIEASMIGQNQASVLGSSSVARKVGSIQSWLTSNVSRGATGANGGYSAGTSLTVAAGEGTQRAFTETLLKDVMQAAYTSGGQPNIALMAPAQKRIFSTFTGIATLRHEVKSTEMATITAAADMYISDFGPLAATPSRQCRTRDCLLIDPEMCAAGYLRPFKTEQLAKTGDAEKFNILVEWTLVVKNQAALGIVADLT